MTLIDRETAYKMAMAMYTNEPCRICGQLITADDVKTAVFAGYSPDDKARSAHRECWDSGLPSHRWQYPPEVAHESQR